VWDSTGNFCPPLLSSQAEILNLSLFMLCCHWLDEFVRSYLRIHHVDKPVWRTGGLRPSNNNTFYWYRRGSRGRHHAFTYSAWPPSRDLAATTNRVTLVLRRFQTAGQEGVGMADFRFRWDTEKPGSAKQPENYAYPFICEAKANSKPTRHLQKPSKTRHTRPIDPQYY